MHSASLRLRLATLAAISVLLAGCEKNYYTTAAPATPAPTPTELSPGQDAPGIVIAIQSITGASGSSFRAGDHATVNFTVTKQDGSAWQIAEFTSNGIFISGPTFNYQRVIPQQSDLTTRTVTNADGSFSYTFADGLPDVFAAPLNDTDSFGALDGELTGQTLLAGTYTVGIYLGWNYTIDGESFRDGGDGTADFLFGGATGIEPRAAVGQDNCNQCHSSLRAHGGTRRSVTLCLLCHTSGSEDQNDPTQAGGTPGVSIDFRVMIHKIHAGANLPSVLGVTTDSDGSRNYASPPQPYRVGRSDDFSEVRFPVFPNLSVAMPRDFGYSALSADNQTKENSIRMGPAECSACHGDPDGSGPMTAPAQGSISHAQPTRRACGSCHDDIDWTHAYTSNQQTMPAQLDDSACLLCHRDGNGLDSEVAHTHPLKDRTFNPGFRIELSAIAEAGNHNGNGNIDPGEKIAATFQMLDNTGNTVAPNAVASLSFVIAGPTSNNNVLISGSLPPAALSGSQPFSIALPETVLLEHVGAATGALGDTFTTSRTPHWQVTGATTSVWVRTATSGGNTTLTVASAVPTNYIDVADATGFARDDYVVLDDATGSVEYLRIQTKDGNRLWFGSSNGTTYAPGPRNAHAGGATVKRVVLTPKTLGSDYDLDASSGTITELLEFGAGNAVIASYTTDYVMPAAYPLALNDAPDLDESSGRWAGKAIVDGTYTVTLWGQRNLTLTQYGESNSYRATAPGAAVEFLVGSATTLEPYALIDSSANCYACHKEIGFHGYGRVGFETCIACHGTAGFGDRPQYVAPNAPATTGTRVSFRSLLHKIHMGRDLANAATYQVVGFGSGAYPNNFGVSTYDTVGFPALPGGVENCSKCHGATSEAWLAPQARNHPTEQSAPVRVWTEVCGSCHDSEAAAGHISINTAANGAESCEICHGSNRDWRVEWMHRPR